MSATETPSTTDAAEPATEEASFLRRWLVMFALGVPGILAVGLAAVGYLGGVPGAVPENIPLPKPIVAVLVMIEPTILLAIAVAIGVALAPRLGLRSHVHARITRGTPVLPALRAEIGLAAFIGVSVYVVIAVASILAQSFVPAAIIDPGRQLSVVALLSGLPVRLFYGGVVEELLLRWGFLTLVAWLGWHLVRRVRNKATEDRRATSSSTLMWGAVVIAAIIFGVLHLPRAARLVPLTSAVIISTIGLNAIAGIGFGWLYWRRSLEAAMVAHGSFHIALVGVSIVTVFL